MHPFIFGDGREGFVCLGFFKPWSSHLWFTMWLQKQLYQHSCRNGKPQPGKGNCKYEQGVWKRQCHTSASMCDAHSTGKRWVVQAMGIRTQLDGHCFLKQSFLRDSREIHQPLVTCSQVGGWWKGLFSHHFTDSVPYAWELADLSPCSHKEPRRASEWTRLRKSNGNQPGKGGTKSKEPLSSFDCLNYDDVNARQYLKTDAAWLKL